MPTPSPITHLYVHVPFCAAKCDYCAFYSEAGHANRMTAYVDAVLLELQRFAPQLAPRTVFFGGGTPSLLPAALMGRILSAIRPLLRGPAEFTVECNPSTVSAEKASLFRQFAVNRISLGVQSLDDDLLERIGRVHSADAAIASFKKLRAAGFDNINLDLMFGLPGQTLAQWRDTLRRAIELQPEHLSTYCLILEEHTRFWSLFQQGHIKPDEQLELDMYLLAIETIRDAGYRHYEVSNFARPGRECAHNIACWQVQDYLGLGPGACSTVGDRRWQNVPDLERYIRAVSSRQPTAVAGETVTPELRAAERAAFGMRMLDGVPASLVVGRWDRQIAELLCAELVHWRNGRLQPTPRGILFADAIAAEFV
jgi:oxygen-independent coproporphyrinogen-3 oxidase